jgi:predicted GIY-YIG superfamily endonuclease
MNSGRKVVYLVRFPNGKIYIGQDRTDSPLYFGSANQELIRQDHTPEQLDRFTVTREILWASTTATDAEVTQIEIEMIRKHRANDPAVGYNRWPKV